MRDVTLASCLSLKPSAWVAFPVYSGKDVTTLLVVVKAVTFSGLVVTDDDRLFITSLVCIADKDVVRFGEIGYSSAGLVVIRTGGTLLVCLTTALNN